MSAPIPLSLTLEIDHERIGPRLDLGPGRVEIAPGRDDGEAHLKIIAFLEGLKVI